MDWVRNSRRSPPQYLHLITSNHGIRNRNHRTRSAQRRRFPYRRRPDPARRRHPRSGDQGRCTGQVVPLGLDWEEYHRVWLIDFFFRDRCG